ncbi:MAG: endonuclease/exonuclease/phosphatase family protein [Pirellulales bacterium]|nr:endonuclease/exonuclease/phosphatase family protein [Pirellulales bacterium]
MNNRSLAISAGVWCCGLWLSGWACIMQVKGVDFGVGTPPATNASSSSAKSADSLPNSGHPLKIMTFNAENLTAPAARVKLERYRWEIARTAHLERVADVIEAANPDVVNLLESTTAEAVELLVKILHEKGFTDYRGYHVDSSDTFTGFDVAVISKFPLDTVDGKTIRHFGTEEDHPYKGEFYSKDAGGTVRQRLAGISRHSLYYITIHGRKYGFLGLHLKAIPDDAPSNALRTHEAGIAQKIITEEILKRGYQPIVLGDLNDYDPDIPDRDEERSTQTNVLKMLKDYDSATQGDELVNVAEKIVRQADRYTNLWDRNENGVSDPGDVRTMIDHILLPRDLAPHITRAFIFHSSSVETSDHWPVVVEILLPMEN